jgi:hypothetical protein
MLHTDKVFLVLRHIASRKTQMYTEAYHLGRKLDNQQHFQRKQRDK